VLQREEGDAEGAELGVERPGHVDGCLVDFGVVGGELGAVLFCCLFFCVMY